MQTCVQHDTENGWRMEAEGGFEVPQRLCSQGVQTTPGRAERQTEAIFSRKAGRARQVPFLIRECAIEPLSTENGIRSNALSKGHCR